MATKQQLDEQKALRDQQLALKEKQIIDAFNLSKSQLSEVQKEKEQASSQLAQQAYISKQQTERVMPDVLAAQGLARTGYVNTRQGQVNQSYKNQYGAIENDLNLAKAGFERQRALQELSFQQDKEALALERQAYELDYRQALSTLNANVDNNQLIFQYGTEGLNQSNQLNIKNLKNNIQGYVDEGYMKKSDQSKMLNNIQGYWYGQHSMAPAKQSKSPQEASKIQKALAVGKW